MQASPAEYQQIEERLSRAEDTIENIDTTVKESTKCKKLLTQNIQEIQDTIRRPNLWIIGIEKSEAFHPKGPKIIFNKIIEESLPNLKKQMSMNIQEAYRISSTLDQKRNSSQHIIIKTLNKEILL
jgi:DNA-binding FrmR family transcriptional regulator